MFPARNHLGVKTRTTLRSSPRRERVAYCFFVHGCVRAGASITEARGRGRGGLGNPRGLTKHVHVWPARGRAGVGAHLAVGRARGRPSLPEVWGRLTFVPYFNVCCPLSPVMSFCEHGRRRYTCKKCGGGGNVSTGGIAAIARIAACGLTNPRAWRTSSGTLN